MVDLTTEMAALWAALGPAPGHRGRVIQIAAAGSGEGVSTVAREYARLAAVRALVARLDLPGAGGTAGSNVHVVYLKHAEATRLAGVPLPMSALWLPAAGVLRPHSTLVIEGERVVAATQERRPEMLTNPGAILQPLWDAKG